MRWEIRGPWPSIEEIERRFDQLLRMRWERGTAGPPADVFLLEDEIVVEVDLPGVEAGDVHVSLEGSVLVVEGSRPLRAPAEGARAALLERVRGFRRAVPLPEESGGALLEFRLERGVLRARVTRARR
jgi:HSP20 family molecular chaperone IbpA